MSRNGSSLDDALKSFVSDHPRGWGHSDWEALLEALRERGLDEAVDELAIGAALEKERLRATLDGVSVRGVGPKRKEAIVDSFGRLWELQQASASELARQAGMPRRVAEELVRALRR